MPDDHRLRIFGPLPPIYRTVILRAQFAADEPVPLSGELSAIIQVFQFDDSGRWSRLNFLRRLAGWVGLDSHSWSSHSWGSRSGFSGRGRYGRLRDGWRFGDRVGFFQVCEKTEYSHEGG